jgi:hypothetical protein
MNRATYFDIASAEFVKRLQPTWKAAETINADWTARIYVRQAKHCFVIGVR